MQEKSKKSEIRILFVLFVVIRNYILIRRGISDLMPIAVDQISKRYTVCLLCVHCKFYVFLPEMRFRDLKFQIKHVIRRYVITS